MLLYLWFSYIFVVVVNNYVAAGVLCVCSVVPNCVRRRPRRWLEPKLGENFLIIFDFYANTAVAPVCVSQILYKCVGVRKIESEISPSDLNFPYYWSFSRFECISFCVFFPFFYLCFCKFHRCICVSRCLCMYVYTIRPLLL